MIVLLSAGPTVGAVTIVVPAARQRDAGYVLACHRVLEALKSKGLDASVAWRVPGAPLPAGDLIVVGEPATVTAPWRPPNPDGFRIAALSMAGRRALAVEGDERGTMYGLFKLAERIRIGDDPWRVQMTSTPAFGLRIFSEEGQLLDIPDIGYYSDQPPYVNVAALRKDIDQAKRLLTHVAANGFNAFAFLHLNVEEYIDYAHLDKPIYPPDDLHRVRSPVFCKLLTELCDYAHALHLDIYMQVYEIAFPPRLDELYRVDIRSPNIERIINARYRELFERVPLDGMIITATEQHPRCGYKAKRLWGNRAQAGRMATLYHNACNAVGKRCIYRLWRVAYNAEMFAEVARHAPRDAVFAIKNTGGDYYLDHALTTAISDGMPKRQPLVVLFDTFREFDGWSRLFCVMTRWGERVRACRDNGVMGINAWGPWSPGCIWPDANGTFSWAGHWNRFRTFVGGFTPGQANVYLIGRLGWNPDDAVESIVRDFAALHLGPANAEAGAEALLATEDAFNEEYVRGTHPCYLKWTMIFAPLDKWMEAAYKANTVEDVLASNARALDHVKRMTCAFERVDPKHVPDAKTYAAFKEGIDKTALFLRTFYAWRACWWRQRAARDLKDPERAANAAALREGKAKLMPLFDQWGRYPEEAVAWRVTFRPRAKGVIPKNAFPDRSMGAVTRSMESTAASFGLFIQAVTDNSGGRNHLVPDGDLQEGKRFYTNRDYRVVGVPKQLVGLPWIRAANDPAGVEQPKLQLRFTIERPAKIYVAWDRRFPAKQAESPQGWLTEHYEPTGEHVTLDMGKQKLPYDLYRSRRVLPAGAVELGGYSHSTMYLVIVEPG